MKQRWFQEQATKALSDPTHVEYFAGCCKALDYTAIPEVYKIKLFARLHTQDESFRPEHLDEIFEKAPVIRPPFLIDELTALDDEAFLEELRSFFGPGCHVYEDYLLYEFKGTWEVLTRVGIERELRQAVRNLIDPSTLEPHSISVTRAARIVRKFFQEQLQEFNKAPSPPPHVLVHLMLISASDLATTKAFTTALLKAQRVSQVHQLTTQLIISFLPLNFVSEFRGNIRAAVVRAMKKLGYQLKNVKLNKVQRSTWVRR